MEGPIPADPDPDPDPESLMAEIIPDKAVSDIRPSLWMSPGFSETMLTSPTIFQGIKNNSNWSFLTKKDQLNLN